MKPKFTEYLANPPARDLFSGRLLLLSQRFWPEEMGTAETVSGIAFELAIHQIPVVVLTGQPAYRKGDPRLPRVEDHGGVRIFRAESTRFDKNHVAGRVLNTATFTASVLASAILKPKIRALLAVTNPPLLLWVAALLRAVRRIPSVLLIHDVYPQIAVSLGRLRARSFVARVWTQLNRWAYRSAARIIVLDECMAEVIRAELPATQQGKVVVIPNCADGEAIRPIPRESHPLLREWGMLGRFVVLYSGNIGLFHELETVAAAAERLRAEREIQFVFIGEGGQLPWLRQRCEERQLDNVMFLPFQPKERLPLTLTACDVGLVTLNTAATGFCSPGKLYTILAAGKPVVAVMDDRAEAARVARRYRCGVTVAPGDSARLAAELRRLREQPALVAEMGRAARAAFDEQYTVPHVARQYAAVLLEVVSEYSGV